MENTVKYIKVKNPNGSVKNFLSVGGIMQSEEIKINGKKLTDVEFKDVMIKNGFEILAEGTPEEIL